MANSYTEIAGDGVTTIFSIPFGYIDVAHIDVLVDGLPVSFEWIGSATVSVLPAPEVGSVVRISRVTPKDPIVDFRDGESLTESDLDSVGLQALYLSQESEDNLGTVLQVKADGVVDGMNRRIRNVANPVDAQDVATKLWAETGMSSQLSAATLQAVIATNKAQEAADSAASAAANAAITVAAGYNPANVTITGGVIGGISNLGLGTPAPSVAGWSTIRMEGTSGGNLEFNVGGTLFAEMYTESGGDLILGTASAGDDIVFRTKGVTRGQFSDGGNFFLNGNMAIGDPSASGSTTFGSIRLGRSTGGSIQFYQGTTARGELFSNGVNISLSADDPTGEVRLRAGGSSVLTASANGVVIDRNSALPALRVTQAGAGAALLVEDEANPDATPFIVDAVGNVGIGTSSPIDPLEVVANASTSSLGLRGRASDNIATCSFYNNARTIRYGFLQGQPTQVRLGTEVAAALELSTNNVGRLRIESNGAWGLGGANYGNSGEALVSNGPGLPPSWQPAAGGGAVAGEVAFFAMKTAPAGWLKANGAAVSRSVYPSLFNALCPNVGSGTVTIASPGVFTIIGHGLNDGDPVRLTTTGALPTGLNTTTTYFVVSATANTFSLSLTAGGAAINTSGTQSGTHLVRHFPFGAGDGSTTFNLPDLRGEFVRGWDDARGVDTGRALGSAQASQNLAHNHTGTADSAGAHTHTVVGVAQGSSPTTQIGSSSSGGTTFTTGNTSSAGAHTHTLTIANNGGTEARPRNVALLACIKF